MKGIQDRTQAQYMLNWGKKKCKHFWKQPRRLSGHHKRSRKCYTVKSQSEPPLSDPVLSRECVCTCV